MSEIPFSDRIVALQTLVHHQPDVSFPCLQCVWLPHRIVEDFNSVRVTVNTGCLCASSAMFISMTSGVFTAYL
uniref:Uncharacterized protein n=1 Tax=Anguilla anguilla TaxID=7936 RepID=A0A0E9SYB0_ANGAN